MQTRWIHNEEDAVAETFPNEVIVLNLVSGIYYSIEGTGALLWQWTVAGHTVADMARALSAPTEQDVADFIGQFETEGLIRPSADRPAPAEGLPSHPWAPPVMNDYRDLEQMLLLDPIHEVAPTGWPNPRPV